MRIHSSTQLRPKNIKIKCSRSSLLRFDFRLEKSTPLSYPTIHPCIYATIISERKLFLTTKIEFFLTGTTLIIQTHAQIRVKQTCSNAKKNFRTKLYLSFIITKILVVISPKYQHFQNLWHFLCESKDMSGESFFG